jgi:hypothetical protein
MWGMVELTFALSLGLATVFGFMMLYSEIR